MKGSLATSAVLHALVLTWALVSLGSPADFEVADVEALPVDIVPIESITQIQQGDKKAPAKEKASPVPTKKPTPVENAENIGDNDVDLKTPPTPDTKPVQNESAAAPEKTEKAPPTPDPVKEEIEKVEEPEPASEPATEVATLPEPKQEVKPETKPEPAPAEEQPAENPEAEALPDKVPTPMAKPRVEKPAQTAKTPERKKEETKKEQKKAASQKESDFNADEIAALLNKQESSGGGAKRSTEEAALGGKKTTSGNTLSQSEMDALRGQIQNNWSIIPGMADAADVRIKVTMRLDPNGELIGEPEVEASGGSDAARRALMGGARRAILKSAPFKGLPADKYDSWSEVVVNFDPSSML
ncbi:hypothetical protein [Sinorhizobium chiapasense]|uniref:Cell division and transport-associated protein TolA n=1 Tax=Sinorhizobium chiapasense TaxID=501572 RepID=A0ABZ2B9R0_9HYPH